MTFAPNLLLKSRWKILSKIGQGAFGETYIAEDIETRMKVCVKMESTDKKKQMLKAEAAILKSLQGQPHVCQFFGCGRHQGYNFIVMELLGHNLSQFRRVQPKNQFPVSVTAALAIEMLGAIEVLHENGYLHRDIKPSNFALGIDPVAKGIPKVYVIDFGLSRRYRSKDGSVKEPRNYAGFRGTARYASLNSHHSKELSRKDDLWSLFYLLVEFLTGNLPWKKEKERDQIGKLKEEFTQPSLVQGLPPQMLSMLHHINQLTYRETPNYSLLRDLFQQMLQQTKENPVPFFRSASLQIPLPYSKFLSNIPAGLTEETVSAEVPLLSGPNQKDHSEESFEQLTDDMNDPRRPAAPSAHHPAPMGKLSIDNILTKSEPSHFLPWAPTASGSSSIVLPPIFFLQGFTPTTSQPGFSLPQNATSTRTSSTVSASSTAFSPSANDQQQSQMLSSSSAEGMPPIFYQQLLPHYQHLQASDFHPYYQPKPTFQPPQQQQPPQIALQQQQFFLYQQQQQQQQQQYMQQQFLPQYQQYQQQQQQQQQQHRQEEFMKQQLLLQQQQLLLQAQQEQRNAAACANSLPVSSPSDSSAKRRRSPTKGGQSRTQTAVYSSRNNSEEERGFSSLIEGDQPLAAVAAAHPKKKRARLLLSEGEHDDPTEKEKHCSSDDNHASSKGAPPQLSFLASRRALPLAPSEKPVYS